MSASASGTSSPAIRCEALVVGWAGTPLLPAIDLTIERGALLTVVGRNGAGKTTWFKTLLGLTPPVSGKVVRAPGLRVAYVPQSSAIDAVLPIRARDVVLWGRLSGWSFLRPRPSKADRDACERAIEEASVSDFAHKPYRDLSKGQRQRVLFARMLASDADVSLLDEPTAAMDAVAEREAMARLRRLAHEKHKAIIVVSHALEVACQHSDRVLHLDRHHGEVFLGTPQEVLSHASFVAHYGEVGGPRGER